jgi:hypothetical protein
MVLDGRAVSDEINDDELVRSSVRDKEMDVRVLRVAVTLDVGLTR